MIEIPATISKQELSGLRLHYECRNDTKFKAHDAGTLELVTFIGAFDAATRNYIGAYHCKEVAPRSESMTVEFNELPGIALPRKKKG